jgi:hypothetical protein
MLRTSCFRQPVQRLDCFNLLLVVVIVQRIYRDDAACNDLLGH